jgi:3-dehydroquinate dehydratase
MKIIIINGPNLNLLGKREPEVYGNETFETYFKKLQIQFPNITLEYFQSNIEGEIISKIQVSTKRVFREINTLFSEKDKPKKQFKTIRYYII